MTMMRVCKLLLLCTLPYCLARKRKNGNPDARDILVINYSGGTVDLFWINPQTKELVSALGGESKEGGIAYGADTPINSYVSHSFEIQEIPDSTGKCRQRMCRKAYFTVNRNEDQVFTIRNDFSVDIEDNKSRATEKAKTALQECREQPRDKSLAPEQQLAQLTECLKRRVNMTIQEQNDEISFQKQVRRSIGQRLTQYACDDRSLNTTDSVRKTTWVYHNDRPGALEVDHDVSVLVESDSDAALVIHKAVTPDECHLLVKASSAKDGSIPLRKRKQLKSIVDKIEALLSDYLNGDVELDEEPMLRVKRATPAAVPAATDSRECVMKDDGTCQDTSTFSHNATQIQIINPTRAAHLEIVCEAPQAGGGWLFHRAGAFMNPKASVGDAVLMRFYDPATRKRAKDPLLDEYVECPVLEGNLVTITVDV